MTISNPDHKALYLKTQKYSAHNKFKNLQEKSVTSLLNETLLI